MRNSKAGALALAGILAAAVAPLAMASVVEAQDPSVPAPEATPSEQPTPTPMPTRIPAESATGRPDLYLDMPYFLGGFEPEIVMTRGEEHLVGLEPDGQTRRELEGMLEAVGAEIDDMVSGYALVSQEDFFSFVVAIRVDGIGPGSLLPAYLPILYDDLEDPQGVTGQVAGKDVLIITSLGEGDEYVELYVYDEGDTVWMLQGPGDVVETALSNLPGPLPRDG